MGAVVDAPAGTVVTAPAPQDTDRRFAGSHCAASLSGAAIHLMPIRASSSPVMSVVAPSVTLGGPYSLAPSHAVPPTIIRPGFVAGHGQSVRVGSSAATSGFMQQIS